MSREIKPRKPRYTLPKDPWAALCPVDPVNQLTFLYTKAANIDPQDAVIHAMILCAPEEYPDDPEYVQTTIHHFRSAETGEPIAETATCHKRRNRPAPVNHGAKVQARAYRKRGLIVHEEQWIANLPYSDYTIGTDPADLGLTRLRLGHRRAHVSESDHPRELLIPSPERTAFALDAHAKRKLEVRLSLASYKRENPDDDLAKLAE